MYDQKGFTLLEVMIALAVLAGVVVTVISSINYHLTIASGNSDVVTAALLARSKSEEVAVYGLPSVDKGEFEGSLHRFSWSLAASSTEIPDLQRVDIRVVWDGGSDVVFTSYRRKE